MRDGSINISSNKEEAIDYIWQIRGEAAGSIRLTYFASGKMRQFFIVSQAKNLLSAVVNEAADRRRIILCRKNERDGTLEAGTAFCIRKQISSGGRAAGGSEL